MLAQFAVAIKFDVEGGQFVLPLYLAWCDCVAWPYHQCAMDAICGDRVRSREFPVRKNRLHNFIAERDPFDAIEQHGFVHTRQWRRFQAKHDFRLDARLGEIPDPQSLCVREFVRRAVGGVAPNRRLDAVDLPHLAICEPDLATSYSFAAGLERGAEQRRDTIGLGERQSARPRGEGGNLAKAGQRRDDLVGDGSDVERFGQLSHTRTLFEVMAGTSVRGSPFGSLPALGIEESFLTGKHGPCPLCGGKDRWRWDNLEGRGTWICSKCGAGDGVALVMRKNGWEFCEAAKQIERMIGSAPADTPKRERSNRGERDWMNKLWRSSNAVESNDPVGSYLFRRTGLTSFPACLRTAYHVRYQSDRPSFHPAMIAMVTGPDGAPSILHRTFLTDDGYKAPVIEPRLWMPGLIAKGAAIRLAPAGDTLGIAEGIETSLSASALFGVPCWAAGNAGMLAAWQPPPEAKRIIIFGDNDANYAGQAAAYALGKRLGSNGRVVEVQIPTEVGADWNDVHLLQLNRAEASPNAATSNMSPGK